MTTISNVSEYYITTPNGKVRYLEAGSGPPLVLVHALGVQNSAEQWLSNFEALTPIRHVYAIDMPGWGKSDVPNDFSFPMWVESIKRLFDELNLGQADLMGQSLGGWVAALFAHQHPEHVRRFVWLAQAGMNPVAPQNAGSFQLPSRENLEKAYAMPGVGARIYEVMTSNPDREAIFKRILDYINREDIREHFSMRSRLPDMKMPVLFGQGDANRAIPVEYALEAFKLTPLGRLTVAMGGAAPGGYNSPELVNAAIKFFEAGEITAAH